MRASTKNLDRLRDARLIVAILGVALVVRLLYLQQLMATPLADSFGLDAAYYLETAQRIAAGDWLGSEVFFFGPFYPYWLALVGGATGFSPLALRLAQIVIGVLTTFLLYWIGARCFGRRTAGVAALAFAVYGMAIYYDNQILMTGWVTALLLVVVADLLATEAHSRWWRPAVSGALLGVAALTRASVLASAPVALGWLAWRWSGSAGRGRRLCTYVLGLAAVLGLTATRNRVVGDDWVLVTSNGGLNFYIGNYAGAPGTYQGLDRVAESLGRQVSVDVSWMKDDPTGKTVAEAATGRPLRPSEVSRFYLGRTLDAIAAAPGSFLRTLGRKALLFWNAHEIAQIDDPELHKQLIPLWRWPLLEFGVAGPLALLGLILAWRAAPGVRLLQWVTLAYAASVVLFFVTSRYRAPIVPVLLLFASHATWWLFDRLRARRAGRPLLAALLVLGLSAALIHLDLARTDPAAPMIHLGIAQAKDGDLESAIGSFERAVQAVPGDPTSRYNLAAGYLKGGRFEEAAKTFGELVRRKPTSTRAWLGLAQALESTGAVAEAERALYGAETQATADAGVLAERARLNLRLERPDSALAIAERGIQQFPEHPRSWEALTRTQLVTGRTGIALVSARRAFELGSQDPLLLLELARLELESGNAAGSRAALAAAGTVAPGAPFVHDGWVRFYVAEGKRDSATVALAALRRAGAKPVHIEALEQLLEEQVGPGEGRN